MMNRSYGDPRFQSNRIGFPSSYGRSSTVYRPFTDQRSGFASSRQPRDYGEHDRDYDSNYQAWRNNQMAELDRDYHEYRQENQQKFENEFGTWRQRRCSQRDCLGLVTEHMDVIGSDGEHVGKVDRSEEHTSELQSLMRLSYAVFCLQNKKVKKSYARIADTNAA